MKKALITILIIIPLVLLLCAFSFAFNQLTITIKHNGSVIFLNTYTIDYLPSLALFFRYGGNYQKMYENSSLGNVKSFFSNLNSNIVSDIEALADDYYVMKKDASVIRYHDGKFEYAPSVTGVKVNQEKIFFLILTNKNEPIDLPLIFDDDVISENQLKSLTKKIGSFSTSYEKSSIERKRNIELALEKLDNVIIEPNGNLSFNEIVGKRTLNNGFLNATVINNGEYVEGVGGGVCQVSTTLYNAWLYAGLLVAYSHCHSIPSSYVRCGFDAMVSDNTDLVLTNSTLYPIYLDTYYDGKIITITLYGEDDGYDIELTNELVKSYLCCEYDTILTTEEEKVIMPKNGYLYKTYRLYKQNGILKEKELLRSSYYPPKKGIKYLKNTSNNMDKNNQNSTQ